METTTTAPANTDMNAGSATATAPVDTQPATTTATVDTTVTTAQPPAADNTLLNGAQTAPADVIPEAYSDYTLPEGFAIDKAETEKFNGLAKDLGLSQEKAQKLVDYYAGTVQGAQQAQAQQAQAWTQESLKTHGAEGV